VGFQAPTVVVPLQMKRHDPDWVPSCFMIDASKAEMAAIRTAFAGTVPYFICTWHVHKAASKQLKVTVCP
jgi:hypothetical protein